MAGITRKQLAQLARSKRADARLLLKEKRWASAYYLHGLAVELGVKAIVAKGVIAETIPGKRFSNDFYQHDLAKLVVLAGLKDDLEVQLGNSTFKAYWESVLEWEIDSRYEMIDETRARAIAKVINDRKNGVFRWLRTHW